MADEKSFPTLPTGTLPSGLVTFMFTDNFPQLNQSPNPTRVARFSFA